MTRVDHRWGGLARPRRETHNSTGSNTFLRRESSDLSAIDQCRYDWFRHMSATIRQFEGIDGIQSAVSAHPLPLKRLAPRQCSCLGRMLQRSHQVRTHADKLNSEVHSLSRQVRNVSWSGAIDQAACSRDLSSCLRRDCSCAISRSISAGDGPQSSFDCSMSPRLSR